MLTCAYCRLPAQLVTGAEIYPHRDDLAGEKFWRCVPCSAWVGCHKAGAWVPGANGSKTTSDGTLPLGRLANAELRALKRQAHGAFDPIWKARHMNRREAYAWLAGRLGINATVVHIGDLDEAGCRAVIAAVEDWKLSV